jgi:hypothetical protein
MKAIVLFLTSLFAAQLMANSTDVSAQLISAFQNGNSSDIANKFASTVYVALPNITGSKSKEEAKTALEQFFKQNAPSAASLVHQVLGTNKSLYIISLQTKTKTFRVSVSMTSVNNVSSISDLKIE